MQPIKDQQHPACGRATEATQSLLSILTALHCGLAHAGTTDADGCQHISQRADEGSTPALPIMK
jgi:hypothetical protein